MVGLGYISKDISTLFMEIAARVIVFCFHCFGAWLAFGGIGHALKDAIKTYHLFQSKPSTIINHLSSISGFTLPFFMACAFIAYYLVVLRVIIGIKAFELIFYNKITRSTYFFYLIMFLVTMAFICLFIGFPLNILASKYKYK